MQLQPEGQNNRGQDAEEPVWDQKGGKEEMEANNEQAKVRIAVNVSQQPQHSQHVQIAAPQNQLAKSNNMDKRKQKKDTESRSAQQGANTEESTAKPRSKKGQQ